MRKFLYRTPKAQFIKEITDELNLMNIKIILYGRQIRQDKPDHSIKYLFPKYTKNSQKSVLRKNIFNEQNI